MLPLVMSFILMWSPLAHPACRDGAVPITHSTDGGLSQTTGSGGVPRADHGPRHRAEEVVQDAWIRLAETPPRGEIERTASCLFRLVRDFAIDHARGSDWSCATARRKRCR